jgi:DNA-binding HxlR family transcriptional regulator
MLNREYEGQNCSIAGTLELVGERWTLLILRDAFLRVRRFEDFQRSLGIARNVLSARLQLLCDEGILERRAYQERPVRYEYRLTEKGIDLWPILMTIMKWGDRHMADDGPPMLIEHKGCGGLLDDHLICDRCGQAPGARDCAAREGPGQQTAAA